MECGIVGLPGIGKSCLFSALTGAAAGLGSGAAFKANVGVAHIPDPRLELIATFVPTKKIVRATMQFVDIPGVAPGSTAEAGKTSAFLANVRQVDALCHVVRCFEQGGATIDPARDIDALETELIIADLQVAESAMDKVARTARSGEADAKARVATLQKLTNLLSDGKPARSTDAWSKDEKVILKGYGMITAQPVLYVANVAEDDLAGESTAAKQVRRIAAERHGEPVALCAKLEGELAELAEPDRSELLKSLGLEEPAIGPLARAAYKLLGLGSFYTAGEKEVRAWTVPLGATAPEAAGAIHSDIQRGFIRAECYHVDDLTRYKSEKSIKEAGKLRSEGKSYHLQDGDVVHFLFNV